MLTFVVGEFLIFQPYDDSHMDGMVFPSANFLDLWHLRDDPFEIWCIPPSRTMSRIETSGQLRMDPCPSQALLA